MGQGCPARFLCRKDTPLKTLSTSSTRNQGVYDDTQGTGGLRLWVSCGTPGVRTRRRFRPVLTPYAILQTPDFPENGALRFNQAVPSQIQALLSGDFDALRCQNLHFMTPYAFLWVGCVGINPNLEQFISFFASDAEQDSRLFPHTFASAFRFGGFCCHLTAETPQTAVRFFAVSLCSVDCCHFRAFALSPDSGLPRKRFQTRWA